MCIVKYKGALLYTLCIIRLTLVKENQQAYRFTDVESTITLHYCAIGYLGGYSKNLKSNLEKYLLAVGLRALVGCRHWICNSTQVKNTCL